MCSGVRRPNNHVTPRRGTINTHALTPILRGKKHNWEMTNNTNTFDCPQIFTVTFLSYVRALSTLRFWLLRMMSSVVYSTKKDIQASFVCSFDCSLDTGMCRRSWGKMFVFVKLPFFYRICRIWLSPVDCIVVISLITRTSSNMLTLVKTE